MEQKRDRNAYVDSMRGIAILLVVLGHTMTGTTSGSQNSFLFNIVWSLQMPLFFLISGYVTRYSRDVSSAKELFVFVKNRTISYMLPWLVWTILIRGLIFQESNFLNIKELLWHMDTGYWFLFSIWVINIIFVVSKYFVYKLKFKSCVLQTFIIMFFCGLGMLVLLVTCFKWGFSFLCMKQTIYYMPFFLLGFMYGKLSNCISNEKLIEFVGAICLVVWIIIIVRVKLYTLSDGGFDLIVRFVASISGCIALFVLCKKIVLQKNRIGNALKWFGTHSLEIYLLHSLLLNFLELDVVPEFETFWGIVLTFCNFSLTVILTSVIIAVVKENRYLQFALFGKVRKG